jgi:prepilin-type N-terminal cleavage/methylation domain-containing protein
VTTFTPAGPIFRNRRQGFTLVEILVATSLAALLTLAALTSFIFTLRGERSLANYSEMNAKARKVLEQMGRDFRSAGDVPVGGFNSTSVTCSIPVDSSASSWQSVVWAYNPNAKTVTRTLGGVSTTYASDVSSFAFTFYNITGNTPVNDVELKQIQLSMRILRNVGTATTSEYVISAQFTLRSKSTTI